MGLPPSGTGEGGPWQLRVAAGVPGLWSGHSSLQGLHLPVSLCDLLLPGRRTPPTLGICSLSEGPLGWHLGTEDKPGSSPFSLPFLNHTSHRGKH